MIMSLLAGELEHAVKLLPVGKIEAGVVEAGMKGIVGVLRGHAAVKTVQLGPVMTGSPKKVDGFASGDGHAHAIDLEPMQAVDAVLNDVVVAPVDQPVGGGAIEEVVLSGSLPDEVPRILRIDGEEAAAMRFDGLECAGGGLGEAALLVGDGVLVVCRQQAA